MTDYPYLLCLNRDEVLFVEDLLAEAGKIWLPPYGGDPGPIQRVGLRAARRTAESIRQRLADLSSGELGPSQKS